MVGTDYPYSNFLPRKGAVIQIDERAMALGRRAPTAFGAVGSARPTLKLLLGQVAPKSDTSFWERVTKERREWDAMLDKQADPARSKDCIHPPAVARAVTAISGALAIDGPVTPWSLQTSCRTSRISSRKLSGSTLWQRLRKPDSR